MPLNLCQSFKIADTAQNGRKFSQCLLNKNPIVNTPHRNLITANSPAIDGAKKDSNPIQIWR